MGQNFPVLLRTPCISPLHEHTKLLERKYSFPHFCGQCHNPYIEALWSFRYEESLVLDYWSLRVEGWDTLEHEQGALPFQLQWLFLWERRCRSRCLPSATRSASPAEELLKGPTEGAAGLMSCLFKTVHISLLTLLVWEKLGWMGR